MHDFKDLLTLFDQRFGTRQFPEQPATLYDPAQYILELGGKRIRPVLCLMGCELFGELRDEAFLVAQAVELFHNFSLIHDDIMDKAALRRGKPTLHTLHGSSTAILAGDVMMIRAYQQFERLDAAVLPRLLAVFNQAGREVCEGQQLDMDFESRTPDQVNMDDYLNMIRLKTSILLAASLKMGGLLGGGSEGNLGHLYRFGEYLGLAFQVQDDYLDAFGNPEKFGKTSGGDILANKKTFLLLKAYEVAAPTQRRELDRLLSEEAPDKVDRMLQLYRDCEVDHWAERLKQSMATKALKQLEDLAVLSSRKRPLHELADVLLNREV